MSKKKAADTASVGKKRSASRGVRIGAEIPPELEQRLRKYMYENNVSSKWVIYKSLEAFLPN